MFDGSILIFLSPVSSSIRDSQELLATAFGRGHPDVPADAGCELRR